jgi:hypothetical protein
MVNLYSISIYIFPELNLYSIPISNNLYSDIRDSRHCRYEDCDNGKCDEQTEAEGQPGVASHARRAKRISQQATLSNRFAASHTHRNLQYASRHINFFLISDQHFNIIYSAYPQYIYIYNRGSRCAVDGSESADAYSARR